MRIYALSLDGLGRGYEGLWMAWRTVIAHPNEPLAHRIYARLLQKSRQYSSALCSADEALRLSPTNADALVLRGSILHDLGRIRESNASYEQALTLEPGNADALNNISVNRLARGKFAHALRGFLGAAGSDPALGDLARSNIGVVLRRVPRWVIVAAVLLGFLVAFTSGLHSEGQPTGVLRVLAGLVTAGLIAVFVWLLHIIPRQVSVSVLREQYYATLRIVHALVAVAAGVWVTIFPGPVAMVPVGASWRLAAWFFFESASISGADRPTIRAWRPDPSPQSTSPTCCLACSPCGTPSTRSWKGCPRAVGRR